MKGTFSGAARAAGEKPVINEPFSQPGAAARAPLRGSGKPAGRAAAGRAPGDSRLRAGIRLYCARRWDEALQELLCVDAGGLGASERVELSYYLGLCFSKLRKFADALPCLEKVVAFGGDMLRVYQCRMALAYAHVALGRPKMAEYELRRLLDLGFESAMLFNTMAYASYARKHYRHAIEFYEKALKLESSNATALNSIGYILADTGIDPLKGLRFCRKAVEIQPGNAAYLDSLGWAFHKCREPAAARSWLRKAHELAPQEAAIAEHLRAASGGGA